MDFPLFPDDTSPDASFTDLHPVSSNISTQSPNMNETQSSTNQSSRADDTAGDRGKVSFKKTQGFCGLRGEAFEYKMCALVHSRATNSGCKFLMASSMKGLGAFDDIVLKIEDRNQTFNYFLQLKSKQKAKINEDNLFGNKSDFNLIQYHKSYLEVRDYFKTNESDPIFNGNLEGCTYILYTNTDIHKNLEPKKGDANTNAETDEYTSGKFLMTGGKVLMFNETDHKNIYDKMKHLKDYKEFLANFKIMYNQAKEDKLDMLITEEIRKCKILNRTEIEIAVKAYRDYVQDWWQKSTIFLNESFEGQNPLMKTSEYMNLTTAKRTLRNRENEIEKLCLEFTDSALEDITKSTNYYNCILILAPGGSTTLTSAKLHQSLTQRDKTEHMIIKLQDLVIYRSEVFKTWKSELHTLIVEVHPSKESYFEIFSEIGNILSKDSKTIKVIFIIQSTGNLTQQDVLRSVFGSQLKVITDSIKMADFTSMTQESFLEKRVIFQGNEIKISELVNVDGIKMLEQLDSDSLSSLLGDDKPKIGTTLQGSPDYYIDRTLQTEISVRSNILREHGCVFALCGSTIQELRNMIPPGETIYNSRETDKTSCRFVYVESVEDFNYLCMQNKDVHWLRRDGENFIWKQSQGNMNTVKKHLIPGDTTIWRPNTTLEREERIVMVTAEPGMGKTTLLTHLAKQTVDDHPDTWIIRININGYSRILDNIKKTGFQENKANDLLLHAAGIDVSNSTLLEKRLFLYCCQHTGNMAVLVDGVDEVNPFYSKEVFLFLRHLKKTKIRKLWMTARSSIKEELEEEFGISSYSLIRFTKNDQRSFLIKYWKPLYSVSERELGRLADDVLNIISKSFSQREEDFLGIPLQTLLVAEIVTKQIVVEEGNIKITEQEQLSILSLYDSYTKRKWDIYLKEKKKADETNVHVKLDDVELYNSFIRNHKLAGMISFLSTEELTELNLSYNDNEFLQKIQKGEEKTGIIINFKDGRPEFIHRTFAEYFVAMWFEQYLLASKKFLQKHIFTPRFEVIRIILDRLLSVNDVLHTAVINDDLKGVERFYKTDTQVPQLDSGGRTALHLAVVYSSIEVISFILNLGANINFVDRILDWTPLDYVIKSSKWSALAVIMEKRPETRQLLILIHRDKSKCMKEIITECCKNGYEDLLLHLLHEVINKDSVFLQYNISLLHETTRNGHINMVKMLTKEGMDLNVRDGNGKTLLHVSSEKGYFKIVEFLVEKHFKEFHSNVKGIEYTQALNGTISKSTFLDTVDEEGNTALHLACKAGKLEVVRYLLEKGSSTESRNKKKQVPLVVAAQARHYKVAYLLLEKGCRVQEEVLYSICELEFDESKDLPNGTSSNKNSQELLNSENEELIEKLLEFGANIEFRSLNGNTTLHAAGAAGNLDIFACILKKRPNMLHVRNKKSETPLFTAATNGKNCIIEYLLSMETIDIECKDAFQNTPLHMACIHGHQESVELLLNKGVTVNNKNSDGETPVFLATRYGHYDIVNCLLSEIDHSIQNKFGCTILLAACSANKLEIAKLIFNHTAASHIEDTDNIGNTCLHLAVSKDNLLLVEFICNHFHHLNTRNKAGETALFKAAAKGHFNLVNVLINRGADVSLMTNKGIAALDIAIKNDHVEVIKLLYETNACCGANSSPLFSAAMYGNLHILTYLIRKGENVNAKNGRNQTILHWACLHGHFLTVKYLIDLGAHTNVQDKYGRTPLHYATENENINMVHELVNAGASTKIKDERGCILLHIAASKGYMDIVIFLENKGSPVDARNMRCETPLFMAALRDQEDVTRFLIMKGAGILVKDINGETLFKKLKGNSNQKILSILRDRAEGRISAEPSVTTDLHESAKSGDDKLTLELLTEGHPVDVSDNYGRTPLWYASFNGHASIVNLLCEYGSGTKTDNMGLKPLQMAIINKEISVIEFLLHDSMNVFSDYSFWNEAQLVGSYDPEELNETRNKLFEGTITRIKDCGALTWIIQELLYKCCQEGFINTLTLILNYGGCLNCTDEQNCTPLHTAVYNGHMKIVRILIKNNAPLNSKNNKGQTPLHLALVKGDIEITKFLLENGAMTNIKDCEGRTSLHLAVNEGCLDLVELLVNFNASMDITDAEGKTPFMVAVCENKFEVAEFFLNKGANIESSQYMYEPLFVAIRNSNLNIVKLLIKSDVNPNAENENGSSPLLAATYIGNIHIVEMLINAGAIVDSKSKDGWTALHAAIFKKHHDIVSVLLHKGANVNSKSNNGVTPLHIAVLHNEINIVKYLLYSNAFVDDADEDGCTSLHLSAQYGYVQITNLLLDNNCNMTKSNMEGFMPLHTAVRCGNIEVTETLINRGCSVDLFGERNVTPLLLSAIHNYPEITQILLDHHANINIKDHSGLTVLHASVSQGHMDLVQILINKNADVNISNEEGMTPLHFAVQTGNLSMVKLLIENSASLSAITRSGKSPLELAARLEDKKIAEYLHKFYT